LKDETESKKGIQVNDVNELQPFDVNEVKMDAPPQELGKIEFSGSQENSDVVEDCINLNVEDEENFEEVSFFQLFSFESSVTNNYLPFCRRKVMLRRKVRSFKSTVLSFKYISFYMGQLYCKQ
jgi:hypothetical protein